MKRPWAMIAGTGHAAPKRVMRNSEFPAIGIDTSDEWIRERTGIRERHIAGPDESLTSISTEAAHKAMAVAGVTRSTLGSSSVSATLKGQGRWVGHPAYRPPHPELLLSVLTM